MVEASVEVASVLDGAAGVVDSTPALASGASMMTVRVVFDPVVDSAEAGEPPLSVTTY